jgi:carbamoyltransferase
MFILGVNAGPSTFHDSSACIVDEKGMVISFIEEERLTRVRHAPGPLPVNAVAHCLTSAGISASDVDVVATGWDVPRMSARWGQEWKYGSAGDFLSALGLPSGPRPPDLQFFPHHRAHAASAFYASGYQSAAVIVADGNGEDESISIYRAETGKPMVRVQRWPRVLSLGYMYDAVSSWLGLGLMNAGKTMGLAAYGRADASFDPGWFGTADDTLTSVLGVDESLGYRRIMPKWEAAISASVKGSRVTTPTAEINADPVAVKVAWAAQAAVEAVLPWLVDLARRLTGETRICLAGGVALNCAANGRLSGDIYVPPMPHDAGVAVGAAWLVANPIKPAAFSPYTGGVPGPLRRGRGVFAVQDLDLDRVAAYVSSGLIGAVARGASEVGPRALCHRSIIATPTLSSVKQEVNSAKDREQWRPFGPVTNCPMGEDTPWWGSVGQLERYMVGATDMTAEGEASLPAAVHVDGTTRPQRLTVQDEPFVDALLDRLAAGGHPRVLINTSLNGRGEPLVETAEQALDCAVGAGLDYIVINDDLLLLSERAIRNA